ncbi:MAG: hypothetical protein DMG53_14420 [Acidobacteria bacterium]|nr:MAG: hypothetical protein DMG53_14420 [Acidobacteriota bacterium]
MFASLNVHAGVDPEVFAGQLHFLEKAFFARGCLCRSGVLPVWPGRDLRLRRGVLTDQLRPKSM